MNLRARPLNIKHLLRAVHRQFLFHHAGERRLHMSNLVLATAAFLATHFVSSTPLRTKLVGAIGEWPYRGLYSLIAFGTLAWMIWGYATAEHEHLWTGPRTPPYAAMPLVFVLLARS